eukprot:CAMPEP_0171790110 /NCGR_PEP_ID=MMETSP0991-20121206/65537_1 /TAXON_ID=483369 /ORGANISM="non described non described, Strain CCMP2098" /LENGTH=86 /DNA_ID=CAMNT_0012399663 /DNA_START=87 /DNA_END=347 /DNA_ORIENTATION=-
MVKGLGNGAGRGHLSKRAHRTGIKKMPNFRFKSTKGMDPKYLRNMKFAKKYNGTKRFKATRGMDPKYLRNMKFAKKYNGTKREKDE